MRVLVLETNLLWTSRLRLSLAKLGHEATVSATVPETDETFDLAIVNLGEAGLAAQVAALKAKSIPILGHAGHKEKDLHELGRSLGVDRLATNSELTHKLPTLLEAS